MEYLRGPETPQESFKVEQGEKRETRETAALQGHGLTLLALKGDQIEHEPRNAGGLRSPGNEVPGACRRSAVLPTP